NTLKIDKSFLDLVETEKTTRILTETIVYLARKLGLETIAEGVETEGQFEIMREMGCDLVQGYLLSRPITKDAMEELIRQEI
ncbi:MAG: EAL domain-containing protein, partial [Lachnospiraceae bacterium]|nr:EAL domain-containing protein [Lachnospiraceae bacterium]